jgi:AAA+ superfamily predicted ATPase
VRQAILQKLSVKAKTCCLSVNDVDTAAKIKKSKKITAYAELENLIGLAGVKKSVNEITTFLKKRGKTALPCLHMAFLGNPGTGKTTVARIIARIFAETGVTKKNLLVETDREGLVGAYVGHTAIKTKEKIEEASGGVLFIDEAYSLFTGGRDKIDYGNEAVAVLVKQMEDKRDEFVCILAGYTDEMNDMLNMNPGMRDRISFYIDFPDYSPDELLLIFEKMCRDNKYKLSQPAADTLKNGFARIAKVKSQNFSNGRFVRKIFERVRMKQALRASNSIITDGDIIAAFAESDISAMFGKNKNMRLGFGT